MNDDPLWLVVFAMAAIVALAACCGFPLWLYVWTVETIAGAC